MQNRAAILGQSIRVEQGVKQAVEIFHQTLASS